MFSFTLEGVEDAELTRCRRQEFGRLGLQYLTIHWCCKESPRYESHTVYTKISGRLNSWQLKFFFTPPKRLEDGDCRSRTLSWFRGLGKAPYRSCPHIKAALLPRDQR